MIRLNQTPTDERFTTEFLAHSLALLGYSTEQDAEMYERAALRFTRPEPPRDPDLPLLPDRRYPRYDPTQIEQALQALQPPPLPKREFVGRKAEIEQVSLALVAGRPAVITGSRGIGKSALLLQIAHDQRLRKQFRRIWWLDSLEEAVTLLGVALDSPSILIAEPADQPSLIREQLTALGVLLLIDDASDLETALAFAPSTAVVVDEASVPETLPNGASMLRLRGLSPEAGANWLATLTNRSAAEVTPLAALIEQHPRGLRLVASLLNDDGLSIGQAQEILSSSDQDHLLGLYRASFDALPEQYQGVLTFFAAAPEQWIDSAQVLAHFDNPLTGWRALRMLERHGFIERSVEDGRDQVRATGEWLSLVTPADALFTPVPTSRQHITLSVDEDESAQQGRAAYVSALGFLENGQDTDAERALQQSLKIRQDSQQRYATAQTLTALARLAYLRGDDSGAIKRLESAAELLHELRDEQGLTILRVALSRAYRRAGRLDAALHVLDEASPAQEWAAVYRARGDYDEQIAACRRWLTTANQSESEELAARYGLAEALSLAGRYSEALQVVGDHRAFAMQYMRGMILHLQGDHRAALSAYEQLYGDAPPESRAALARTMARAKAQLLVADDASAREDVLREAAMLVGAEGIWYESKLPRPIFARQRLSHALYAHFCLMLNRAEEAETAARTALDLPGERPDAEAAAISFRVLGRVYAGQRQWEAAERAFEEEMNALGTLTAAKQIEAAEMAVTLHALAEALYGRGERDRSAANYRRALGYRPSSEAKALAITQLALRNVLLEQGRYPEALEVGQQSVDALMRRPNADLHLLGYALTTHAQAQHQYGRGGRGSQVFDLWLKQLAARLPEATTYSHNGVRVLAAGLALRSDPALDEPIPLVDLAEEALTTAEEEAPGTWVACASRRDLGLLYLKLERWQDAIDVLTPILRISPTEAPYISLAANLGVARAFVKLNRPQQAAAHFESAAPLEPELTTRGAILREAAAAYRDSGDDAHAIEFETKALEPLREHLNQYVESVVALAYSRLRLRQFVEAIDTFEEARRLVENQRTPDNALLGAVLVDMASAHASLGQHRKAAQIYKESLTHQDMRADGTRYAETLIAMARSYAAAEQYGEALSAYYDALQFDVFSKEKRRALLIEQAETFANNRQPQAAIQAFTAALAIEEVPAVEQATIKRGLGQAYSAMGDHETARTHFAQVLEAVQDEQTGLTWVAVADGFRAQGQHQEAIEAYQKALATLNRGSEPVIMAAAERSLGELYFELNQATDAIRHLETALEIERALPQQNGGRIVVTLRTLASANERRGELDKATLRHHEALVYQDVRHAADDYIETLRTLGRLYTQMSRYGEAIKAFDEAINTTLKQPSPDKAKLESMRRGLADATYGSGKLETAADLYRQLAKAPQATPDRDAARESLRKVEAEINRHLQTLEVTEQSWLLLRKNGRPDVAELSFIRAMQARTAAALGRDEESKRYLSMLTQLLKDRRAELKDSDSRPAIQALTAWLQGQEAEEKGEGTLAQRRDHYRRAQEILSNDPKANAGLVWMVGQKVK
ncbi:MAG: tetratricopeptide repeat protein [Anaerolineae bacterium]|nr:tetratricopeptide repeat protein [Anaerolineae bacterium]